jgi:hypothetical protein
MKRYRIKVAIAGVVAFAFALGAQTVAASTIISQTGRDYGGWAARTDQFDAISWSQTSAYTNVSIAVRLYSLDPTDIGTAWITTRVGPGTTVADEVATASFLFPSSIDPSDAILFTGLTLNPGTYYLSIGGGTNYWSSWYATDQPVLTMDTGVSYNGNFYVYDAAPYAPASTYDPTPSITPIFVITGTAVPEPASLAFIGITVSMFILFHRPRFVQTKDKYEHNAS